MHEIASNRRLAFSANVLMSGLYMSMFIALAVSLSRLHSCHGNVCGAARANSVFAAMSYVAWSASATVLGVDLSRLERMKENEEIAGKEIATVHAMKV
jgi:hypothetical protein